MHMPHAPDPDQRTRGFSSVVTLEWQRHQWIFEWLRHRWIAPVALVGFCALVAVVWSTTRHSDASGPLLLADDAPTVAGEPSPAIVAAAESVTVARGGGGGEDQASKYLALPVPSGQGNDGAAPAPAAASPAAAAAGTVAPASGASQPPTAAPATASPGGAPAPGTAAPAGPSVAPPPTPTRVFPVNQTQRLTTAAMVDLVGANNITTVADFLSALPSYMGESFVLMEDTRSRHRASLEYPRIIMYGPDARLLLGVSSHPSDPLREVVEVAELDESTGLWRFSQFDFRNAFVHDTDTASCAGCHGSPLRPIWGEYPDWTGAFAGQDERLSGGQASTLMRLKYDPFDRFHQLVFPSDHSIQSNGQLYLPSRQYGYANTSFNFELNAAVADGIARRILNHPSWPSEGYRLLAAQWGCGAGIDSAGLDALYNRFGIDGNNDFQLESLVSEALDGQRDEYGWNQGSTGLDKSVAFRTLDLAAQRDPGLEAIVSGNQLFVDFSNYWFNTLGAQRSEAIRVNGIYETDFRPQNLSGGLVGQVCNYLAGR